MKRYHYLSHNETVPLSLTACIHVWIIPSTEQRNYTPARLEALIHLSICRLQNIPAHYKELQTVTQGNQHTSSYPLRYALLHWKSLSLPLSLSP